MIKSLRGMKACDVVVQSATKRIRRVTVQASSKPDKCVTSRRLILPGLSILIVPQVLATTLDARAATDAGDWSSPGLASRDDDSPKFIRTSNGIPYQVISEGSGPAAKKGDRVLIDFVLRRANGYFIYGTIEGVSFQPRDVPADPVSLILGSDDVVPGLSEALEGMMPGAKRRILVPPELGYVQDYEPKMPTFATKRQLETHKREPLLFEVQMLRVGDQR